MIEISIEPQAIYLNEKSEVELHLKNCGSTLYTNVRLKFQVSPTGLRLKTASELQVPFLEINEVYTHRLSVEALKTGEFRLEFTYFSYLTGGQTCRPPVPAKILKVIELPITAPLDSKKPHTQDRRELNNYKQKPYNSYNQKNSLSRNSLSKNVVLFLTANPVDMPRLQIDEEMRAIDLAMKQGVFHDRFDLRIHLALRLDDLQERLLRYQPQIVHFSGHGNTQHELQVLGEQGQAVAIPTAALNNLFHLFDANIRCVVLNACYSASQAAAIAEHIDCVIGISAMITDMASIQFATAFYRAIAYGHTVQMAFDLGRNQLDLRQLSDADQPQLLGKSDPSKVWLVEGL